MSRSDIPKWLVIDFQNGYTPEPWAPLHEQEAYLRWVQTGGTVKNRPAPAGPRDWTVAWLALSLAAFAAGWVLYRYWGDL
jgi:hypothetical protein